MKNIFKFKKYFIKEINEYKKLNKKPILFIKNLTKKYGFKKKPTLNNVSFNVYHGEFHGFIGANGAGKTTTIKSIIGAYSNWGGTILIDGYKNNTINAKKKLGYIPENPKFPNNMNVNSYLVWMGKISGLTKKQAQINSEKLLKELNMIDFLNADPNNLSSGQKKKILLAQALIVRPNILITDEPSAGLDPNARDELFKILFKLKQEGCTIFISSHVLSEIERYIDSLTIIDHGKILYSGDINHAIKDEYKKNSKYFLITSDNKKMANILKQNNFNVSFYNKNLLFSIKKNSDLIKILQIANKHKIIVEGIHSQLNTLDNIYEQYIKSDSKK